MQIFRFIELSLFCAVVAWKRLRTLNARLSRARRKVADYFDFLARYRLFSIALWTAIIKFDSWPRGKV